LVFIDSAREIISAGKAKEISDALTAVSLATMGGQEGRIQQLIAKS
jgi:hydrogenase expression/formation protein HypC